MPAVFSKPLRKARLAAQPIAVASVPQPKPQAGAGAGFVAATSKVECDK
jgi:hypothetical protein